VDNVVTIKLSEFGASLGSRELGLQLRDRAEGALKKGEKVLIDFLGVHVISSGFADELFGKLWRSIGRQSFKDNLKINGFDNEQEKKMILSLIQNSINFREKQAEVS